MDEIQLQVPLPTQSRCPESPRLQHSLLMCKTNKIILHTKHYFKELVTVKVAVELIMIVKRTQICITWNGPFDSEAEHTCVLICQKQIGRCLKNENKLSAQIMLRLLLVLAGVAE